MRRRKERTYFPADALPERITYVARIAPVFYGGYYGIFPDVPGTLTWGGTIKETRENLRGEIDRCTSSIFCCVGICTKTKLQTAEGPQKSKTIQNDR